jgi:hypothetical protein
MSRRYLGRAIACASCGEANGTLVKVGESMYSHKTCVGKPRVQSPRPNKLDIVIPRRLILPSEAKIKLNKDGILVP